MESLLNSLGWILSIITAAGNGFVILLVAKNRRLHSSANKFVLSMAVADFGVGIAVFPSSYFCKYSTACKFSIYRAFFWFFLHSSVTNLCSLTWDRYIAIVHPFKYTNSMTKRRPGIVILIAWLIPFVISLSLFVEMNTTTSKTAHSILLLTGVSAFDIISCVFLLYTVVRILVVARTQSHKEPEEAAMELQVQFNHSSTDKTNSCRRRKKHKTASFIIAIVAFFLGCYVVVNYLVLCMTFSCHNFSDKAGLILSLFLVLNSSVNPLVYAFLKKDIKMEIKKLICGGN